MLGQKRLRKGIPMLIANDVSQAMGKSTNQITIITDDEELSFPEKEKITGSRRNRSISCSPSGQTKPVSNQVSLHYLLQQQRSSENFRDLCDI